MIWEGTNHYSLDELDAALANAARASGVLRLQLGEQLEALAKASGHRELGFASIEAYALERCERSARWVQESRSLVRSLEVLPKVREALVAGQISFSMAQVIAKVASEKDEKRWLDEASCRTVRQMRVLAKEHWTDREMADASPFSDETTEILTIRVDREDVWLLECARITAKKTGAVTSQEFFEALIGEGSTALFGRMGAKECATMPSFTGSANTNATPAGRPASATSKEDAERICEPLVREHVQRATTAEPLPAVRGASECAQASPRSVDAELRRLSSELATRDVTLGDLAETFWTARGWLQFGYATDAQYARERLGMSLSSVKAKRALARRLRTLPELSRALEERTVGYEAARLVAAVCSPKTVRPWIERAKERTVRHLREEVDAAQMLKRLDAPGAELPPEEETMRDIEEMERTVVSGAAFEQAGGTEVQMSALMRELFHKVEAREARVHARVPGIRVRFRVDSDARAYYRWLEGLHARALPGRGSFLRFLCASLIDSWRHANSRDVAYAHVYERDGYRCKNPTCGRRDVTPHHLRFRSHGGDDSDENLVTLCVFCHLEGVHGGRISAKPPASRIEWAIGREPHTFIRGRTRERAA